MPRRRAPKPLQPAANSARCKRCPDEHFVRFMHLKKTTRIALEAQAVYRRGRKYVAARDLWIESIQSSIRANARKASERAQKHAAVDIQMQQDFAFMQIRTLLQQRYAEAQSKLARAFRSSHIAMRWFYKEILRVKTLRCQRERMLNICTCGGMLSTLCKTEQIWYDSPVCLASWTVHTAGCDCGWHTRVVEMKNVCSKCTSPERLIIRVPKVVCKEHRLHRDSWKEWASWTWPRMYEKSKLYCERRGLEW
jgi:hypothetical protein